MRVKFTNDVNFFVREVGRGSGVLERSLEITEVLRGEEGDDEDRKPVCTYHSSSQSIKTSFIDTKTTLHIYLLLKTRFNFLFIFSFIRNVDEHLQL